uniref:G_PROTEIN_RECEP_F1_2 domain-containing protein n=1 Tax=Steinernema glaseri TaxID=37863 RepID=A0A1I7YJJ3_9BILA
MSSDVVEEYYSSFLYVRRIILINTAFSVPLNFLTMYLILFKTPKHLKTYKYLLLNISWDREFNSASGTLLSKPSSSL